MVFQFEHVRLDQGADKWDVPPLRPARPQGARSAAGRPGSPTSAGTASTGTTTTSRGRCRGSATTASTACASAKMLGHRAAPAPRDAVRLPGRGARDDERALRRDRRLPRHRVAQPLRARRRRRGRTPERGARRAAGDEPRQRAHADAVGRHRRTPASRPATPWLAVNPNHVEINAAAQRDDPDSVLAPLPAADRAAARRAGRGRTATSRCCCRTTSGSTRSPARLGGDELLVLGNFSGEPAASTGAGRRRRGPGAELLVGREGAPGTAGDPIVLAPWEGRAYRRRA